jgi:hypothetical protein
MATKDINITQLGASGQPVEFNFEAGGTLTGNHKLAQSWIRLFLTESGSQPYAPNTGTDFLATVRNGGIRRSADVPINFKAAADTIAKLLLDDPLTTALPQTEQLVVATLDSYQLLFDKSTLKLDITLTPVAGDTITFTTSVPL